MNRHLNTEKKYRRLTHMALKKKERNKTSLKKIHLKNKGWCKKKLPFEKKEKKTLKN